jgi:periplasmic divalent cation tolerance protein
VAEVALILSTFEREEDATAIIRTLLREGLIACGTITRGARSIYVWQDELHDTQELLVLFKTSPDRAAATATRLGELHPYEVPEILTLTASSSAAYARWIIDTTSPAQPTPNSSA